MFLDENVMSQMNPDDIMQSGLGRERLAMLIAGSESGSIASAMAEFLGEESDTVSAVMYDDLMIAPPETSIGSQLVNLCAYIIRRCCSSPACPRYFDARRDGASSRSYTPTSSTNPLPQPCAKNQNPVERIIRISI